MYIQRYEIFENIRQAKKFLDENDIDHNTEEIKKFESYIKELDNNEFISESKNKPTDKKLWDKALRLTKGTKHGGSASVRVDGKKIDSPNGGKGFDEYPSAYANSFAAKMYKSWGGSWKKVNEDLRDWHKEEWVRIDTKGNITGDCGTMKDKDAPTRCLPKSKAKSMSKSERAATAKKKKEGGKKGKKFIPNTKKAKVSESDRKKARK